MKILAALLALSCFAYASDKEPDEAFLESPACAKFTTSLQKHMQEVQKAPPPAGTAQDQILVSILGKVKAEVPAGEYTNCSAAMMRSAEQYRAKSIMVEAKMMLNAIHNGITSHYVEEDKLCPSTKKPAPAKLELVAKDARVATAEDWSDPAWTCAGVDVASIGKQRFQYELKVTGTHIDVIARGYPVPGKLTTLTRSGVAGKDNITWSEIAIK